METAQPPPRPDPWPLHRLVLRTPRLELRPDDDAGLLELVEQARLGVHPPEQMPFSTPWTDQSPAELPRSSLQFHWGRRAALRPESWAINFLVRHGGRVIGTQGLLATDFAVTREVASGSWLGLGHQRRGFGVEMRAAVLAFAFDHLGALAARTEAFTDNTASLGVSRRLGYRDNGVATVLRRDERAVEQRLRLTAAEFVRPDWTLQVEGVDAVRPLLGAG